MVMVLGKVWRSIGAMKICQITIHQIAVLPKIHSIESPFLPKIHSVESPFLPKNGSIELMICQIT